MDIFVSERRRRDLNPCAAVNDLLHFQGSPFGQLGYFSRNTLARINIGNCIVRSNHNLPPTKRRGWDSNPCALADKRFSRPPRYDHFDTSPERFSSHLIPFLRNQRKKYIIIRILKSQRLFSRKFQDSFSQMSLLPFVAHDTCQMYVNQPFWFHIILVCCSPQNWYLSIVDTEFINVLKPCP